MIPLPHAPTHAYACQRRKRHAPGMIALGLRDDLMGSHDTTGEVHGEDHVAHEPLARR
jgi:hypothetical protein